MASTPADRPRGGPEFAGRQTTVRRAHHRGSRRDPRPHVLPRCHRDLRRMGPAGRRTWCGDRPARRQSRRRLYKRAGDSVGTRPHEVVYIEPKSPQASPPPGLPRWPEPGEAFLSPELVRVGEGEGITRRYGKFAGIIDSSGLATPSERLAYVRPAVTGHHGWSKIAKIGSARSTPMGDTLNRVPAGQLLSAIGFTVGGVAIVLLVVAARCGSSSRDRRVRLLTALGGNRWHLALVNLGEACIPVVIGTLLGSVPYLLMSLWDVRIPLIDQVVGSADLRAWAWVTPMVALAGCGLMLFVVVALHLAGIDGGGTRPRVFADRIPRWRLYAGLLGLIAIVTTPYLPKLTSFLAYIAGTTLLWGMLPSAAGAVIRYWGNSAASFGRWAGRADVLIAGRCSCPSRRGRTARGGDGHRTRRDHSGPGVDQPTGRLRPERPSPAARAPRFGAGGHPAIDHTRFGGRLRAVSSKEREHLPREHGEETDGAIRTPWIMRGDAVTRNRLLLRWRPYDRRRCAYRDLGEVHWFRR